MTPTDQRMSMFAALAFGGFTDAAETERVTLWAAEHIERLEAEVARLRAALEKIAAISLPYRDYRDTAKLARHIAREALNGGEDRG